jgi:hypothetical protein
MITFSRSYVAADGQCYASLEEAQTAEIASLLDGVSVTDMPAAIVEKKDAIICALTITDSSRPKARGVKKPRKPKADAQPILPGVEQRPIE